MNTLIKILAICLTCFICLDYLAKLLPNLIYLNIHYKQLVYEKYFFRVIRFHLIPNGCVLKKNE